MTVISPLVTRRSFPSHPLLRWSPEFGWLPGGICPESSQITFSTYLMVADLNTL